MAGCGDDLNQDITHIKIIETGNDTIGKIKPSGIWGDDLTVGLLFQIHHSANMIVMMMSNKDGDEVELVLVEDFKHRLALAGVDNKSAAAAAIYNVDIIISGWDDCDSVHKLIVQHRDSESSSEYQKHVEKLSWVRDRMQSDELWFVGGFVDLAAVENGYHSFFRAVNIETDENVRGKDIAADGELVEYQR